MVSYLLSSEEKFNQSHPKCKNMIKEQKRLEKKIVEKQQQIEAQGAETGQEQGCEGPGEDR